MSSEVNYRQQWAEGEIEAGTLLDAIDDLRAQLAAIQGEAAPAISAQGEGGA